MGRGPVRSGDDAPDHSHSPSGFPDACVTGPSSLRAPHRSSDSSATSRPPNDGPLNDRTSRSYDQPTVSRRELAVGPHERCHNHIRDAVGIAEIDDDGGVAGESQPQQSSAERERRAEPDVSPYRHQPGVVIDLAFREHGAERPFPSQPRCRMSLRHRMEADANVREPSAIRGRPPKAGENYGSGPHGVRMARVLTARD